MQFSVPLPELLNAIQNYRIMSINDIASSKILIHLKDFILIGNDSFQCKVRSILICHKDGLVEGVRLSISINPAEKQALWTHVLHFGFLDLELYPIMIDVDYFPAKLFLAPLKYY